MSSKLFNLVSASRTSRNGSVEEILFQPGVNVLVGEPNTGKSKWIEMIDYVLGEDKTAVEKLGDDLASKYILAQVKLKLGNSTFTAERRWHEPGARSKIFVEDVAYDVPAFRQLLLDKIGIPSVHYPQGNPYGSRTWPELGWRSLFRHLYRRQRLWSDIADLQFPSEQHACILQFLGMAKTLFSDEYGEMVQKEKRVTELQQRKDRFLETLLEVSNEIIDEEELGTAITPEAIASATTRLDAEIDELNNGRAKLIALAISSLSPTVQSKDVIGEMSKEYARLKSDERNHEESLAQVRSRLEEVESLAIQVSSEIGRLERAKKAGIAFADLKATHCPVCDQPVEKPHLAADTCYLCHQFLPITEPIAGEPLERLTFELDQLKGEKRELDEMITSLEATKQKHLQSIRFVRSQAAEVAELLKPIRMATAALIPPEVAQLEMEIGRRVERKEQLQRILDTFSRREKIAAEILSIQKEVEALSSDVEKLVAELDFETAGDQLSDGMNDYVRQLKYRGKQMWTQQQIVFRLSKHDFSIRVGRQKWQAQLGATMTIYFLLAYHYSLLKLNSMERSNVPGFVILDLPAEVEGEKVGDQENFVMEPFIELCNRPEYDHLQIIAAGSAFQGLGGVNRIELTHVWKGTPDLAGEA